MATSSDIPLVDGPFQHVYTADMPLLERTSIISESSSIETMVSNRDGRTDLINNPGGVISAQTSFPELSPVPEADTTGKPGSPRPTSKPILSIWLSEIASTCIAFMILTAVAVVLGVYNGHPSPTWSGGITLNTVVSFGSMLFRIRLMVPVTSCISQLSWVWFAQAQRPLYDAVRFDQASRGLSGSLRLLITHCFKTVAFVGALVTVISLGIGPFFQQTLVFYSSSTLDSDSVSYTSSASDFNNTSGVTPDFPTYYIPDIPALIPYNLVSAVYNGFTSFGVQSVPMPIFSCPSGNCTWEPFPTLAIGIQCRDAPEKYRMNCTDRYGRLVKPGLGLVDGCRIIANEESENSTGLGLPRQAAIDEHTSTSPKFFYFAASSRRNISKYYPDTSDSDPREEYVVIEWVRVIHPAKTHRKFGSWHLEYIAPNSTMESRQCKLYHCVHVIKAEVKDGMYNERILQEITSPVNISEMDTSWNYIASNSSTVRFTLSFAQQNIIIGSIQSPFNDLTNNLDIETRSGYVTKMTELNQLSGPPILQMIYGAPNITQVVVSVMQRMNIALRTFHTYEARELDPSLPQDFVAEQQRVPGSVWRDQIHVSVRWAWLALPASLLLLTIILLVTTIWLSRVHRVGIWKDNSLALLLFSRWNGQGEPPGTGTGVEQDIKQATRGMRAQLARDIDSGGSGLKDTVMIERVGKPSA
ncbi:hypothetical protein OPT61_g2996 [Boeremia exigua]|uniref:Uncharacterized protein n=1 Tax=Boeremia exigua TaxID=749465 RepID=A0ACC2IJJ5_9PLEO|nr:hypothetical protein OPT61_g2996 [Boeremia exigua]